MAAGIKGFRRPTLWAAYALSAALHGSAAQAQTDNWWLDLANDRVAELRQSLAEDGADPNRRTANGQPALMKAVSDGAWKAFDLLAADPRTNVNIENPAGETPLMYFAIAGQTERADALIKRGARVNRLGWTPLHYAASKGQLEMAKLLLKNQAMPNAPAPDGTTPLMMAAFSKSRDMVKLLLDAGADATTRNQQDQNAADWAVQGKANSLAVELKAFIAATESARRVRITTETVKPSDPLPSVPVLSHGESDTPDAPDQAVVTDKVVEGVSGLGLTDYDDPKFANP